jgi:lysophospholipase L1-like esterase
MTRVYVLLLTLLAVSACDLNTPTKPSDPTNPAPSNAVSYTAVGASDAIGYGSSVVCIPFTDCPDGVGYVQLVRSRLTSSGKTVSFLNLGIPGGVLGPELQTIGNQLGKDILTNFLDNEMPFIARNATLVTVFAGGNDANTIGAALEAGYGGSNPAVYQAGRITQFGSDLRTLMAGIKSRAPAARIVVVNVPNFAALPYASSYSLARKQTLQSISVGLSAAINNLRTTDGALVVDVMCDATFYQPGSYSSDGFHPNDAGYAHLADLVYPPASTGTAPAPKASCPQMSIY